MPQSWQMTSLGFAANHLQSLTLRKIQESIECFSSDRMSLDLWQVLLGQISQSVPGRDLEELLAA